MIADPRTLLRKLNSTCTKAFEAAASSCVSHRHYEVTVEHVLMALLDDPQSDVVSALAHYNVNAEVLRATVGRTVGDMKSGNPGKPTFSTLLLEWIQDSWVYASTELGEGLLRSGALLVRLIQAPNRYLPVELQALEQIPRDELRKDLPVIAAMSGEAAQQAASAQAGAPAAGGPAGSPGDGPLQRFTSDLTQRVRDGELDPIFGREREIRQMIEILVRRRKNNPIIVGEAGVGKTALVEGLAQRVVEGSVPDQLKNVRVLSLDLGALQAGAGMKGEFENRLKGVVEAVKSSATPIILFIDEAHTIIGAGGAAGGSDAANLLKPALARGELRTVAATTYAEYKKYFEKDAALERRFQPVHCGEPSVEVATVMLRGVAPKFEESHGVVIRDEAVVAAVTLSSRYISGRQLPDKAVDLLDTSAAYVNLVRNADPAVLEDTRAELAAVERELAAMDRDDSAGIVRAADERAAAVARKEELSQQVEELAAKVAAQREITTRIDALRTQIAEATAPPAEATPDGEAASGEASEAAEGAAPEGGSSEAAPVNVEELRASLREELDRLRAIKPEDRLVAADVDESAVASIVADWTGIPVGKMVKDDVDAIVHLEERMRGRVRGQDMALAAIAREVRAARSGLKPPNTPLGVFLLVGPSGVGKTETALTLADLLFGGERFVVTINMSEFQERHTVSRLIGSPPGYVGYGEGGVLTEAVRHRPYSVVLLDEVEKADKEVLNLFYQVFDKGTLSDGEGREVDFKNTIIILTSNLATDLITTSAAPDEELPEYEELTALIKPTLSAHFKPALLARMTVVPYIPIRPDALKGIARMKLGGIVKRAEAAHGLRLEVGDDVVDAIAARCQEVESGARNVDHILRGTVMPLVSSEILRSIADGEELGVMRLVLDEAGEIACEKG
ncbi:MAG: type VI secretion system ATPase TssH [Polyangiaceae bacterium]|nr:type VI secretion system ATPase TssH [Polyangiaceae bacterium]MCW5789250.1 type VI secretion system ATPase TssH [Polyangiaceae bacterium]